LGDTAVAVHPKDARGRPYLGKQLRLPIANVEIPVIADDSVDMEFGTGFVKVTPAHDPNDFDIGMRHKLAMPLVMREDGTMGEEGGQADGRSGRRVPSDLVGVDRFEARKRIVKQLEREGLLVKIEPHPHSVRRCYRCDTVVEPRLSDQWFAKMKSLAEPVLAAYRRGEFRIVPERWRATFEHWMENIRDWNISRQLWWGHRIPVFTCTKCQHQWADREDPTECPECDGGGGPIEQDPDVLDTWFSSWLWPFATFGWPQRTDDLARFYPGHTLVTAPEILQLWVSRMLMSGYHFMDQRLPFQTVYLTGTVRDTKHRKMSKSLGNGIDPRDVVRLYGTDALRWTLIGGGSLGADVIVDPDDLETTFAPGRNFANKLWNIGRFILSQLPAGVTPIDRMDKKRLTLADRWILSRAQATIREATDSLEQFRLDEAAKRCYEFVWNELADWYVEAVKPRLADGAGAADAQAVLAHCFDVALRLLHPVVPFITEELWQKLPGRKVDELIAVTDWPVRRSDLEDGDADAQFARIKTAIEHIRSIRAEYRIPPKTHLAAAIVLRGSDRKATFEGERETIVRLAQLASLTFDGAPSPGEGAHAVFGDGSEVVVALTGAIDVQQECKRLAAENERLAKLISDLSARLSNESFVSRAPADVVARERDKEKTWREQRDVLAGKLRALGCS
jgi:valyl-tRNA synthetase